MTTEFKELPIIDLSPLTSSAAPIAHENADVQALAKQLCEVFETVGFAYLVNLPLDYTHNQVFKMTKKFFALSEEEKLSVAKKTFRKENPNTYRGYFPAQPGKDNYKEGFEIGPPTNKKPTEEANHKKFNLTEPNVFPEESESFPASLRADMEGLYKQLDLLSRKLLSLLAIGLGKPPDAFDPLVIDSVSTLRFLHYPFIARSRWSMDSATSPIADRKMLEKQDELSCTTHTDSGLLTLLHQDATGGLEVLNSAEEWIPVRYVPTSIVVNIGDIMAELSGNKFVATQHRVRRSGGQARYSVPFFFEPGVDATIPSKGKQMRYEDFVLGKMATWIEFQDVDEED